MTEEAVLRKLGFHPKQIEARRKAYEPRRQELDTARIARERRDQRVLLQWRTTKDDTITLGWSDDGLLLMEGLREAA